jgi:hypothetical protein
MMPDADSLTVREITPDDFPDLKGFEARFRGISPDVAWRAFGLFDREGVLVGSFAGGLVQGATWLLASHLPRFSSRL